ncbi:MAG: 50S ribosomal protein L18 [Acidovorax sp.]|nr:MAG: 50S ribosomal protein L18 [Acidovorax sp.]
MPFVRPSPIRARVSATRTKKSRSKRPRRSKELQHVDQKRAALASASTAEADVRKSLGGSGKGGNAAAAQIIGKRIAEKAKAAGVEKVAFDRAGFAYHGRVKALADAAREAGLQF